MLEEGERNNEDDEDWALWEKTSVEAEARLAARRQARAEARVIRMRELEKQQKEAEDQSDRHYELLGGEPVRAVKATREATPRSGSYNSSYAGSRRSSEDSSEAFPPDSNHREFRQQQLTELEEKFRRAMVSNAQLDNERSTLQYQVDILKDELEEMEEYFAQHTREYREKSRNLDQVQREFKRAKDENQLLQECLKQRDQLIQEHGLVLVCGGTLVNGDVEESELGSIRSLSPDSTCTTTTTQQQCPTLAKAALVSQESALLLEQAGQGTLEERLKRFMEEKQDLIDEIYRLRLDLEEERQKAAKMEQLTMVHGSQPNGPDKLVEVQREANKQVGDYKYKLKKYEQEVTTLQTSVSRLEGQVVRYKTAAEAGEKVEDELKAEKRKIQRELRESQARIEELETANAHLQKRIDKLKSTRNALMKS